MEGKTSVSISFTWIPNGSFAFLYLDYSDNTRSVWTHSSYTHTVTFRHRDWSQQGEYKEVEQRPDPDLGKTLTPGFRNVSIEVGREYCIWWRGKGRVGVGRHCVVICLLRYKKSCSLFCLSYCAPSQTHPSDGLPPIPLNFLHFRYTLSDSCLWMSKCPYRPSESEPRHAIHSGLAELRGRLQCPGPH